MDVCLLLQVWHSFPDGISTNVPTTAVSCPRLDCVDSYQAAQLIALDATEECFEEHPCLADVDMAIPASTTPQHILVARNIVAGNTESMEIPNTPDKR